MNIFEWLKTNKTTVVGTLTVLWTAFSALSLYYKWLDTEVLLIIGGALAGLGLISAKDANKHSTVDEINKATVKKRREKLKE